MFLHLHIRGCVNVSVCKCVSVVCVRVLCECTFVHVYGYIRVGKNLCANVFLCWYIKAYKLALLRMFHELRTICTLILY